MDIFGGSRQNWTSFRWFSYVFLVTLLKVNVENENICAWQNVQIFSKGLIFPMFFGGKR